MGLFGPSKDEIWRQLSEELGGQFGGGAWLQSPKVMARHGNWVVTLDTFTEPGGAAGEPSTQQFNRGVRVYTRLRAPYANRDGFQFTISRTGLFSWLGKRLHVLQDVTVGDGEFDREFIVQGNDEERVRQLLSDRTVRELLQAQPRIMVTVKDDEGWFAAHFPEGIDELYFQAEGVIDNPELLRGLFDLFAALLDRLCAIGSAYDQDPSAPINIPAEDELVRPAVVGGEERRLVRPSDGESKTVERA